MIFFEESLSDVHSFYVNPGIALCELFAIKVVKTRVLKCPPLGQNPACQPFRADSCSVSKYIHKNTLGDGVYSASRHLSWNSLWPLNGPLGNTCII